jgi:hypothetical protein
LRLFICILLLCLLESEVAEHLFDVVCLLFLCPALRELEALCKSLQNWTDDSIEHLFFLLFAEICWILCQLLLWLLEVLVRKMKEVLEWYLENAITIGFESILEVLLPTQCDLWRRIMEGAEPDWKDLAHVGS